MSVAGNAGFQEPPKVVVSDVINFQVGAKALQTSFAKALQEADTESVVIVNLHQPLRPTEEKISNAKIRKNRKKKQLSLNQQIRQMIQKSLIASKYSKETRKDESIENGEDGMFVIHYNRGTSKQTKDREDKIQEENLRKKQKFDQIMHSASYKPTSYEDFERVRAKNRQEFPENVPKDFSLQRTLDLPEEEKEQGAKLEEAIVAEGIDNKRTEDEVESELDTQETLPESDLPATTSAIRIEPTETISVPMSPLTTIASSSSISPHCIMSLPPDFFELFEKLVGVMMIQQSSSGIAEVTLVMHRPGSPLDKSEILLQFFDTNPRSCNVELRGSPEAVHYFHKYHGEFVANFRESKLSLQLNIRKPSLLQDRKITRKRDKG